MVKHNLKTYDVLDLTQGFEGKRIDFGYRKYSDRKPDDRLKYDDLKIDLLANGMRDPLITYRGRILIGMRRFEIMRDLGQRRFPCVEIEEDVGLWWKDDLPKLEALKDHYYA